jgi:phosphoribosylformimino-5-aminoimidazole carboxamide ribotide isomerase
MDILPAIDIRAGKVVRLSQGDYNSQTTYSDDPSQQARDFASAGARWIHVVDLDAAKSGRPENLATVRAIRKAAAARIELGGGIRSDDVARQMIDEGVDRLVIGSAALENWEWFESLVARKDFAVRIALGLDAREGNLATRGWLTQTKVMATDIAARVKGWPLGAIIYTDIARDGMLTGVNAEALTEMMSVTNVPVIASGGVASLADVKRCKQIGCAGVIVGRAYYEGKIDIREACQAALGQAPQ